MSSLTRGTKFFCHILQVLKRDLHWVALVALLIIALAGSSSEFIYFQF